MNKELDTNSNYQIPKEEILEEIRKKTYNSAPSHNVALALDSDMKRIANRIDRWEDFVKEVANIFFNNYPFGMISTHIYCFGKEYNSDQNDLINSVFCFLADNYGNCSKDNYNRLIKNPELALQHSKEENSKYQFIDVKDSICNTEYSRKFSISIKNYNPLTKSLNFESPIGIYYIDEKRLEIDYHLSKLDVNIFEIDTILTALMNLKKY